MMTTQLGQLYREYESSIAIQKSVIEENRKRLSSARRSGNYKEIKRLNNLLSVLYEEKSELEERAHQLKKYLYH